MAISQKILWTALPNGVDAAGLHLSVFVAPQLNATTPNGDAFPPLSLFPDFVNWPQASSGPPNGPITFMVTIKCSAGTFNFPATIETPAPPAGADPSGSWAKIFNPTTTAVEPFVFQDFSSALLSSFPVDQIAGFVEQLYGAIGTLSPTNPIILSASRQTDYTRLTSGDSAQQDIAHAIEELGLISGGSVAPSVLTPHAFPVPLSAFSALKTFHAPLANPTFAEPVAPTLDFHQALTGLNNYPVLLRMFNLVYDLVIPIPVSVPHEQILVSVIPSWISSLGPENTNVNPWTATNYTATTFRPAPQGPDYLNGMLDLSDTSRFMITDLDTDLAGDRLMSTGAALHQTQGAQQKRQHARYGGVPPGQTALTVPALRSAGPQVIYNQYAYSSGTGFSGLLFGQLQLANSMATWLTTPTPGNLPIIYAEQLMRGHRIDVYTASESSPKWRSLHGRYGTYTFGPLPSGAQLQLTALDEGMISPAASQKTDTSNAVPNILNVHESIARWNGWGLSAQRPGSQVNLNHNHTVANPGNTPIPPAPGVASAPQLSAYFTPPNPTIDPDLKLLFPRLRFGSQYRFRARGVDLAGNSVSPDSLDDSTATDTFTHYRYEPVSPPALVGTAPFVPGEGTYYVIILNDLLNPPTTNGRWVFPPRVAQLVGEEHGMLDGFVLGSPPDPNAVPASDSSTYDLLVGLDSTNISEITTVRYKFPLPSPPNPPTTPLALFDPGNQHVPYYTGSPIAPWTPYFPDPLSFGPAFNGLPGVVGAISAQWNGTWPVADPILLELSASSALSTNFVAPSGSTPGTFQVTLPPAQAVVMRMSSALTADALDKLGVWQWFGPGGDASLPTLASDGQLWLLSPFQMVRMVHAVRRPLVAPKFQAPVASRDPGSVSVNLDDPKFLLDDKSTGHIDVSASWTDRYDDPTDPTSDPSAPASAAPARKSSISSGGPAFRLTVPDPAPLGPEAQPMTIYEPAGPFSLSSSMNSDTHEESATHHVGDTKHHLVFYRATGASRFAEMFTKSQTTLMTVGTPVVLGTASLGVGATTVVVESLGVTMTLDVDYSYDAPSRSLTLLPTAARPALTGPWTIDIAFQPITTLSGPSTPVHVLSSAPPKAPVISQIVPAWQLDPPKGSLTSGGISVQRNGGFLRVYLERPWFTSGDGEMLGVVTTVTTEDSAYVSTFPSVAQQHFVTMMGVDPINYVGAANTPWPVVPTSFGHTAPMPVVPYRPPYSHPPQVNLAVDPEHLYMIWPYNVNYDASSGRWYADIAPRPGITQEGTYAPPPGYFIRLALTRFQPYSTPVNDPFNVTPNETSPVVLATFAQPVPDRSVSIVHNSSDPTNKSVVISVSGPGYQGWRPPQNFGGSEVLQYDANNPYAPSNATIYGADIAFTQGKQHTSTMVVEIQVQDANLNKMGISGDLAWQTVGAPVTLPPTFSGETLVTWGATASSKAHGIVHLPFATNSTTKMRMRLSELDYYTDTSAPAAVNTNFRRPFISLIPLN